MYPVSSSELFWWKETLILSFSKKSNKIGAIFLSFRKPLIPLQCVKPMQFWMTHQSKRSISKFGLVCTLLVDQFRTFPRFKSKTSKEDSNIDLMMLVYKIFRLFDKVIFHFEGFNSCGTIESFTKMWINGRL